MPAAVAEVDAIAVAASTNATNVLLVIAWSFPGAIDELSPASFISSQRRDEPFLTAPMSSR